MLRLCRPTIRLIVVVLVSATAFKDSSNVQDPLFDKCEIRQTGIHYDSFEMLR